MIDDTDMPAENLITPRALASLVNEKRRHEAAGLTATPRAAKAAKGH